jgi:hypothetical protein
MRDVSLPTTHAATRGSPGTVSGTQGTPLRIGLGDVYLSLKLVKLGFPFPHLDIHTSLEDFCRIDTDLLWNKRHSL